MTSKNDITGDSQKTKPSTDKYREGYERIFNKNKELQAKVDSLMLEYCPEEMTREQIKEWKRHQVPYKGD